MKYNGIYVPGLGEENIISQITGVRAPWRKKSFEIEISNGVTLLSWISIYDTSLLTEFDYPLSRIALARATT